MSQFAPTILVYISQDKYQALVESLEERLLEHPLHRAGVRVSQLNGKGAKNASVADLKDAAAIVILGSETLNSKQRSLTESALYQQVAAAGPRNPTTMLLCQFSDEVVDNAAPQALDGNNLFSMAINEDRAVEQLLQAIAPLLSTQLCVKAWPNIPRQGADLLQFSGYRPDSQTDNPQLQAQLALAFGQQDDLQQEESLRHAPDAANYLLHRRWGMRNLALGNRKGAIESFNQITRLDDGDPMANFWLSRLLSHTEQSKADYEQAIRRAELLHSFVARLHPEMSLLGSLALLHRSRALHQLRRYDEALETLQQASKLCAHQEVLKDLVRMSLQKLLRDGDLRREHVAEPLQGAIDALESLFSLDHLVYYRFMRILRAEFSPELLSRLNQKLTEKLQKACVPLYRSESEITLFCAEQLQQPLLSPGNAKPLPPWQQLRRAHISSKDQYLLLKYGAESLRENSQELNQKRAHQADLASEEESVDSRIEHSHQMVNRQRQNIKGARIATISALMLMIGSAGLFWWSGMDRSLAWIPFIAFFAFTVLFAMTWKRQGEQHRATVLEMRDMEQKLSQKLDDVNHSPVTLDGLFERLDYLASQLREHLAKVQSEVAEQETNLRHKVKRFIGLVSGYEQALKGYNGKFDTTDSSESLQWRTGEQPLPSLLPDELNEYRDLEMLPTEGLILITSTAENNRTEVYFSQSLDAHRFEQLKAKPKGTQSKELQHQESNDNVVAFRPKLPLPEPAE